MLVDGLSDWDLRERRFEVEVEAAVAELIPNAVVAIVVNLPPDQLTELGPQLRASAAELEGVDFA